MPQKIQAVRGMNDLLPEESWRWEWFEDTVRDVFRQYGYRLIRTPIVEPTGLFKRSIGEVTDIVEKEMYSFVDVLNGDELTLRPEGTAGIVRSAVENGWTYNQPQRVWTVGPMFRHERPAKGRYRQFHQFDAEALGYEGPDVDAEQIVMLARIFDRLGLKNINLQINSIGDAPERKMHREKLIAYFEQHKDILDENAQRRLYSNPLRILDMKNPVMMPMLSAAPKLIDFLQEASLKHFDGLKSALTDANLTYSVNPQLVRGMDYYNRTVFEWVSDGFEQPLTVAGGGRYDGLFEQLGGKPTPACGFGMGNERIMLLLQMAASGVRSAGLDAYVVHVEAGNLAWKVGETLRNSGKYVAVHAGGGSFKSQMKRADASGAKYAVIIGTDEAARGGAGLKPLRIDEPQRFVAFEDLVAALG
jgi:histidyl-tRNA synthetase